MQTYPAVPSNARSAAGSPDPTNPMANINLEKLGKMLPTSNFGAIIAICSVSFTCLVSLCLCCRRCRKRGRGETDRHHLQRENSQYMENEVAPIARKNVANKKTRKLPICNLKLLIE